MESQSHSARIKYSATSIHLGCCSYRGNIRLALAAKKKREHLDSGAEQRGAAVAQGSICTRTFQPSRLNLECWLGRCTSAEMFLATQVKHTAVSRGREPRALPLHQCLVGEDEPSTESKAVSQYSSYYASSSTRFEVIEVIARRKVRPQFPKVQADF